MNFQRVETSLSSRLRNPMDYNEISYYNWTTNQFERFASGRLDGSKTNRVRKINLIVITCGWTWLVFTCAVKPYNDVKKNNSHI